MRASLTATSIAVVFLGFWFGQEAQGQITTHYRGLYGYIGYNATKPPAGFGAGMSFYSAVWPLNDEPVYFQIGLAGSWITPDNSDDTDTPLAPVGTYARDNWPERGPTWSSVFQTLEGGLGYWAGNRFRYGQPKFSMNSTPQCYDYEVGSPGWSFFQSTQALADNRLGIAQLSNRLLIPPDALPFSGNPNGQFLGYGYMALPFTDATTGDPPTGDQAWTCFLSSANFKGPMAFFIPETWSKIGKLFNYPYIYGRGLDARAGVAGGGAMEINTVPCFESVDSQGVRYAKIPKLQFPVDNFSRTLLVRDLTYYSKSALYDAFKAWRDGGPLCSGSFNASGAWKSTLSRQNTSYGQAEKTVVGIGSVFDNQVYFGNVWGLSWSPSAISPKGIFPQYFKEVSGQRVAVAAADVPGETGLLTKEFTRVARGAAFTSPTVAGAWKQPGPSRGPFTVTLLDGSKVTYYWYKFIDQPSFQQYAWSAEKKALLQAFVEQIHANWPIDRDYMAPPTGGELAAFDPALFVQAPAGLEVGYVPIVTRQENAGDTTPPTPNPMTFAVAPAALGANSITMTATTASDAAGPVTYYFENTTNSNSSAWIASPVWTNTGLPTGITYGYRVKARDTSLNETAWSAVAAAVATAAPVITTLSPADDTTGVAVDTNLVVTFSKAITSGSGFITLKNLTDGTQSQISITDTARISIAGAVLTIDPATDLAAGKSYAIRIDATAIKDLSNNQFAGIANDTTWNFTMGVPGTIGSGGTITYTDSSGLNPRSSPPYPGGHVIHTFSSSGTFVVTTGGDVEYLVVAGGGGGGMRHGGGGGAGGLVTGSTSLTPQSYAITVGAGGAGANSSTDTLKAGSPGSNSVFGAITAIGGGGGRTYSGTYAGAGGSGGGGAGTQNTTGGSGTSGQGYAGGSGSTTASGSGGGGAGQAGSPGSPNGGKGGDGVQSSISGVATYYAGGGGGGGDAAKTGGTGGLGGGGHGGDNGLNTNQTAGTDGTGGGGGGCRSSTVTAPGSAGGSGIVIVRYVSPSPTLASSAIADDKSGGPVAVNTLVTFTVTFSKDMDASTVSAADFGNAGSAAVTIGTVTETTPGIFAVPVTPTGAGTLQLKVMAGAVLKDVAGNSLITTSAIADNTTLTVTAPYAAWAGGPFQDTLTNSSPALDFDGGGLATVIEWVTGGDPTKGGDDAGLAPTFDTTTDPNGKLLFGYRRSDPANADANTTIAVQYGSDLTGWTTATHQGSAANQITISETPDGPGFTRVTVALPPSIAGTGKLFVRLKVVLTQP